MRRATEPPLYPTYRRRARDTRRFEQDPDAYAMVRWWALPRPLSPAELEAAVRDLAMAMGVQGHVRLLAGGEAVDQLVVDDTALAPTIDLVETPYSYVRHEGGEAIDAALDALITGLGGARFRLTGRGRALTAWSADAPSGAAVRRLERLWVEVLVRVNTECTPTCQSAAAFDNSRHEMQRR